MLNWLSDCMAYRYRKSPNPEDLKRILCSHCLSEGFKATLQEKIRQPIPEPEWWLYVPADLEDPFFEELIRHMSAPDPRDLEERLRMERHFLWNNSLFPAGNQVLFEMGEDVDDYNEREIRKMMEAAK